MNSFVEFVYGQPAELSCASFRSSLELSYIHMSGAASFPSRIRNSSIQPRHSFICILIKFKPQSLHASPSKATRTRKVRGGRRTAEQERVEIASTRHLLFLPCRAFASFHSSTFVFHATCRTNSTKYHSLDLTRPTRRLASRFIAASVVSAISSSPYSLDRAPMLAAALSLSSGSPPNIRSRRRKCAH